MSDMIERHKQELKETWDLTTEQLNDIDERFKSFGNELLNKVASKSVKNAEDEYGIPIYIIYKRDFATIRKEKKMSKSMHRRKLIQHGNWSKERTKEYLSARIWDKFSDWIGGQTCPIIKRKGKKETGYYSWDVERFADAILENIKTYWD